MADVLKYEVSGPIVRITLNRPESGNRINGELQEALDGAWRKFKSDPNLRAAVLTGEGANFCEGLEGPQADLSAFPADHNIWKPVVLAVRGKVRGAGLRYMGQADIVISSDTATFAGAPLSEGLPFEELLYQRRRLPMPMSEMMIFSGGLWEIDANRGYETGWISEVVADDKLESRATELAEAVAKNDPEAVQRAKEVIVRGRDVFTKDAVEQGRAIAVPLEHNETAKKAILAKFG